MARDGRPAAAGTVPAPHLRAGASVAAHLSLAEALMSSRRRPTIPSRLPPPAIPADTARASGEAERTGNGELRGTHRVGGARVPPAERLFPWPAFPPTARAWLEELEQLTTRAGARDVESLHRFQQVVSALRAEGDVTGPFRAKCASAAGWAALLFSSWRHLKYDRPTISGADRVRAFIRRDLDAARTLRRDGAPRRAGGAAR